MKRLLIIQKDQFGYLTDTYEWCKHLRNNYQISVYCYDTGRKKIDLANVTVRYLNIDKSYYLRSLKFILLSLYYILINDVAILLYFEKCSILKRLLPFKKIILDIRTLAVYDSLEKRLNYNAKLRCACKYFDLISVISEGVKKQINLPNKNFKILPLGANVISRERKSYREFKLLYVGTLMNRHIEKTIEGLFIFLNKYPDFSITYDIIGDGPNNELEVLKNIVKNMGVSISTKIFFHGRLTHSELTPFFNNCNIGVSFIPKTDYFDDQPPTKTFEYILSGLYTIATSTKANVEIVNEKNGLLINDTAEDFARALEYLVDYRDLINEDLIRSSLNRFTWPNIIHTYLEPLLK